MTYSDTQPQGTLRYRLLSTSLRPSSSPLADPGAWGHEYVCHIAAELGEDYTVWEGDTLEQPEGANNSAKPDVKLPGTIEDLCGLASLQAVRKVLSGP
jgi:26S proteasome regulatory subunit N1